MTKISITAAAFLALAGSGHAQGLFSFDEAEGGAFVSGFAGSSVPGDADLSGAGTRLEAEFDTSAAFGGAIGYRLPFKYWTYFQPRLELEISSARSDLSGAQLNGITRTSSGELSSTSFLFNNYNDITWSDRQTIVPFLGGGLGFSRLDLSASGAAATGGASAFAIDDDTTALTTTFAGGLTWHATDRFEVYGEARYTTVYGAEFEQLAAGSSVTQTLEDDLTAATFTVGARIGF
jgi:opacity protein-like surface antigen